MLVGRSMKNNLRQKGFKEILQALDLTYICQYRDDAEIRKLL